MPGPSLKTRGLHWRNGNRFSSAKGQLTKVLQVYCFLYFRNWCNKNKRTANDSKNYLYLQLITKNKHKMWSTAVFLQNFVPFKCLYTKRQNQGTTKELCLHLAARNCVEFQLHLKQQIKEMYTQMRIVVQEILPAVYSKHSNQISKAPIQSMTIQ